MLHEARFIVPGRPVPFVRATGKQYRYQGHPAVRRYMDYKRVVGWAAKEAIREPFDGPVILCLDVYLKDRMKRRWDLSNVLKAVEDGLNGVAYHDDKQVTSLTVRLYTAARHPVLDNDPSERVEVWVSQCS